MGVAVGRGVRLCSPATARQWQLSSAPFLTLFDRSCLPTCGPSWFWSHSPISCDVPPP